MVFPVKRLIDLSPGQRPLRTVVGHVFTEGVAEYNEIYERTRDHLAEVLRRPDQQLRWARSQSSGAAQATRTQAVSGSQPQG